MALRLERHVACVMDSNLVQTAVYVMGVLQAYVMVSTSGRPKVVLMVDLLVYAKAE